MRHGAEFVVTEYASQEQSIGLIRLLGINVLVKVMTQDEEASRLIKRLECLHSLREVAGTVCPGPDDCARINAHFRGKAISLLGPSDETSGGRFPNSLSPGRRRPAIALRFDFDFGAIRHLWIFIDTRSRGVAIAPDDMVRFVAEDQH